MLESLLLGMAGGSTVLLTRRACSLCRSSRQAGDGPVRSSAHLASLLPPCWARAARSTRELLDECKAELEAARVAVDEVRAPAPGKVLRIY